MPEKIGIPLPITLELSLSQPTGISPRTRYGEPVTVFVHSWLGLPDGEIPRTLYADPLPLNIYARIGEPIPEVLDRPFMTQFRIRFPELAPKVQDRDITMALEEISYMGFEETDLATLYATAHVVCLNQTDISGVTEYINVGGVQRRIRPISGRPSDRWWCLTDYGRKCLTLRRQAPGVGFAVVV